MRPEWLDPPLDVNGLNINQTYNYLYSVYNQTLSDIDNIVVDGKHVSIDRSKSEEDPEYERAFIHFITRKRGEGRKAIRSYDEERARKIHWIKPLLLHYRDEAVKSFWAKGPKENSLYIWLEEFDYLLVLKDVKSARYNGFRMVITAYSVDPETKQSLYKKYRNAISIL